jgi:sugar lactone lactonase YvrE
MLDLVARITRRAARRRLALIAVLPVPLLLALQLACGDSSGPGAEASRIYVANNNVVGPGANSITVYSADNNDSLPIATISGPSTGLGAPAGVAIGPDRRVYVANAANHSVTVYSPGANGDVAPVRSLVGANTRLNNPVGLAFDGNGRLYVASYGGNRLTIYAPGARDNAVPVDSIMGDSTGAANSTGLVRPTGIAIDGTGKIYVANSEGAKITIYAAGGANPVPIDSIVGGNTGLAIPNGIALDAARNLYVANFAIGVNTITIYAPGASGNVAPIGTITAADGVFQPHLIAFDIDGRFYVSNYSANNIKLYDVAGPGIVTLVDSITGPGSGLNLPDGIAITGPRVGPVHP